MWNLENLEKISLLKTWSYSIFGLKFAIDIIFYYYQYNHYWY